MKKEQAKKIVETFIRKEVRKNLNEVDDSRIWKVIRQTGNQGWGIASYQSEKVAKNVAAFLNKMAQFEEHSLDMGKKQGDTYYPKYVVTHGKWS